jgi:hypothetical protein
MYRVATQGVVGAHGVGLHRLGNLNARALVRSWRAVVHVLTVWWRGCILQVGYKASAEHSAERTGWVR